MVERNTEDDLFSLEVDRKVGKKLLGEIVDRCFRKHGAYRTSQMLDKVKQLGYHYSTKAGITVGYMDVKVPRKSPP